MAQEVTIINKFGTLTGWNNITLNVLGRDVEGITEISYTDEVEMNNEYGQGKYPQGQSIGNYKAESYVSLFSEELRSIVAALPQGVRIQDIPPFPITVNYENNGVFYKDVLNNCRFKSNGREVKQGDGKIVQKIDLLISDITWNKP
ncbi:MAG TPA: hypothetical protein VN698_09800 [Bacteroidia bacterium]|nr:hypothetical protein [Bacteroidia bacterium]